MNNVKVILKMQTTHIFIAGCGITLVFHLAHLIHARLPICKNAYSNDSGGLFWVV